MRVFPWLFGKLRSTIETAASDTGITITLVRELTYKKQSFKNRHARSENTDFPESLSHPNYNYDSRISSQKLCEINSETPEQQPHK